MHAKCRIMTGGLASPAANDGTGEAARFRICDMILSKNAGYWLLQHGRQLHTITIVIEHMMTIFMGFDGSPIFSQTHTKYTKICRQHKPLTSR
jgi:hypothetical protein